MFGALALSNQDHFRPEGFWRAFKDYDGEPINVREHQDAYEFFTRLQARFYALSATRRPCASMAVFTASHACMQARGAYVAGLDVLCLPDNIRLQSMLCKRLRRYLNTHMRGLACIWVYTVEVWIKQPRYHQCVSATADESSCWLCKEISVVQVLLSGNMRTCQALTNGVAAQDTVDQHLTDRKEVPAMQAVLGGKSSVPAKNLRDAVAAQDTVDQHLTDRKEVPAMQAVLGGKFAQQIICRNLPYRSEKHEDFFQARRPLLQHHLQPGQHLKHGVQRLAWHVPIERAGAHQSIQLLCATCCEHYGQKLSLIWLGR